MVRRDVAENPSTPESLRVSVLEALAKEGSSWVLRWAIARSSSTPLSALETLAKDEFSRSGAPLREFLDAPGSARGSREGENSTHLAQRCCEPIDAS